MTVTSHMAVQVRPPHHGIAPDLQQASPQARACAQPRRWTGSAVGGRLSQNVAGNNSACCAEAATLLAAAAFLARGVRRRPHRAAHPFGIVRFATRRAATADTETTASGEAQAAAEASKLALEAAKLRAEAEDLERSIAKDRRYHRAQRLMGGDGVAHLKAAQLRDGLKEVANLELSEERVLALVEEVVGKDKATAPLDLKTLASENFEVALDRLVTEDREAKRRAKQEELERARKAAEEARKKQEQESPSYLSGQVNDDRGLITRVLGALAYMLPLIDGLSFGVPLVQLMPQLAPAFVMIKIPADLINAIPFGTLIVFLIFGIFAANRELPRQLRFNLQQAVLLDVALFLPSLINAGFAMMSGSGGNPDFKIAVFILLLVAVVYSMVVTLLGRDPDNLPYISNAARRSVDFPPGLR